MDFLNNLKIKNKLILMLIFPIVGLLYFAVSSIVDKNNVSNEIADLEQLSELAVKISATVHETQKERGATGVFMGSKGTKFTTELPAQRNDTDKRYANSIRFLKILTAPGSVEILRIC